MSWWVYLQDRTQKPWCSYGTPPKEFQPAHEGDEPCPQPCYPCVEVEPHAEGGTYAVGGTASAELNITYNYGRLIAEAWDGVGLKEALNGRLAEEVLFALEHAVQYLGIERDFDYWKTTRGNAGSALSILLAWARQHPQAVFRVS